MINCWNLMIWIFLLISFIAVFEVNASPSSCPILTECPYHPEKCSEDLDCTPDSVCCKSPCGHVCTKQLFTGCQTLRMAASRRAKSLGQKSVRMPRCNKSGGFEPIQCDNEIVSSCWCVDDTGFELAGTRAPAAALVNCTAPKACADHTCRMFCPHGFALDRDGCPLCRCRDPCDEIRCPNALECHLEELACADPPCPPIPTCKKGRSLDNICPVGDPLRISDTVRPFLCGTDPGKPNCPPMYQCLVQKGNDYGVCCPASLQIQKSGSCPADNKNLNIECGIMCNHDLECPSVQKCCVTEQCGSSCSLPNNVTECIHQRALSEVLAVSERAGRGYVPQCSPEGEFTPKQCSRNNLVCWCVDRKGRKVRGSMGPSDNVDCTVIETRPESSARSLGKDGQQCEHLECAAICEYGFKLDENGCHTCKCDDPCDGYMCPEDEECVNVRESECTDFLCPTLPICRPKAVYANPCENGTPLTDDLSGAPVACALRSEDGALCPSKYDCTAVAGSTQAVCCPKSEEIETAATEDVSEKRPQTMCEYLQSFSENMEGTREGMNLALPTPACDLEGNFKAKQCSQSHCWCADNFGTEIPHSKTTKDNFTTDCDLLKTTMDCLDLTCRMGCEYGFVLSQDNGCPLCQCRDPCHNVTCGNNEQCQLVEVSCKDHYCPPVPACLPKKVGQCPYLVPTTSISCEFECNSDLTCNGTQRCCSNGCGTQCLEPLLHTACQHKQTLSEYRAHETGTPVGKTYIPQCDKNGSYSPKQCDPYRGECWCVDEQGFELSQTRTSGQDLICSTQLKTNPQTSCPLLKCKKPCQHGYKLDKDLCRTCECLDPCKDVKCREDGETCRLVNVECVSEECPPVPMCLPKKENPCQSGEPLKFGSSDEIVSCGPDFESCPSSHKCQLSPVGEYAVCCPKPRDVCFEPLDKGECEDEYLTRNLTRYFFNSRTNKCETFSFSGCQGNHNNFYTEDLCNTVCPVLSQCERLREKNQRASEKYKKPTFAPRCEPSTGKWQPIQCLEHVGVCWCVTPQGEPLKGTLTRGAEPECNFRQARNRAQNRIDVAPSEADLVLEELMMQLGSFEDVDERQEFKKEDKLQEIEEMKWENFMTTRCKALGGRCDENGKFLPTQCEDNVCWCVDEAGNQISYTNTFLKGERTCMAAPVEKVELTLGFRGEYDQINSIPVANQITRIVKDLKGVFSEDGISTEFGPGALYVKFFLIGSNKVDVAYTLEQIMMHQRLPGLLADITKSRVTHHLLMQDPELQDHIKAMEHREIVSQSPVSLITPYHTALIVIAAASAFVICILTLLVILYKRKAHSMSPNKIPEDGVFLSNNRPIYIELPNEKYSSLEAKA